MADAEGSNVERKPVETIGFSHTLSVHGIFQELWPTPWMLERPQVLAGMRAGGYSVGRKAQMDVCRMAGVQKGPHKLLPFLGRKINFANRH